LPRIQAISAAWLAHMDYSQLDAEATGRHVRLALELADPTQLSALARACLVVGMALQYAERNDLAQPWYARARECASLDGDEATMAALVFNMAWHHANHALQASIFGGESEARARRALLGADSSDNIGRWQGIVSLDALTPMLRAQAHSVLREHGLALALYEAHWQAAKRQGLGRMAANFLADMAWCRWSTGDAARARQDADAAACAIDPAMHADDRAVAHGRLAQLYRAAGETDHALHHEGQARDCWGVHQRLQARFVDQLADLPLPARR
jgi:tetratricopeptide (TPR) repeat protein